MAKLTLTPITSGYATNTALNANFDLIETAIENTISRDGTSPNALTADLDMNGFNILNQGNPITVSGLVWEGPWTTSTVYSVGDIVQTSSAAYICKIAHTSGVFATDLAALKWQLFVEANLPSQTGNSGKVLGTNGSSSSWDTVESKAYTPQGAGAVVTTIQARLRKKVYASDFGAIADGVTNNDSVVPLILATYPGDVDIIFSRGTYKFITGFTVNQDNVHIYGEGVTFDFEPTTTGTCITIDKGATVCYKGSINGITFISNDTTYKKTAIRIVDTSGYCINKCGTIYPHLKGAGSIFLNILGREVGSVSNIYACADKPIVIEAIPAPHTASGIGIDHFNFNNLYLIAASTYPVVTIGTGVNLTQVSFTGHQAWVGGTDGLNWVDTTSTAVSNGLSLENVRYEQTSNATSYLVNIQHNTSLQGLYISGGQGGDRNGIYLRKVSKVHFQNFWYTSTSLVALNIDTTVDDISATNCFWQAGSTATVTGHDLVFATPKNPNTGALAPTFAYCLTSNASRLYIGRSGTGTAIRNAFTETLGGGTITSTYRYTLLGNMCFFTVYIVCAGGAQIASTADSSYISGLPTILNTDTCTAARSDVSTSLGVGTVQGAGILTPTWSSTVNASYVISGKYEIA